MGMMNFFGPRGWSAPLTILFFDIVMLAKAGAITAPTWSVWIGNISYSLYLVHVYVFEIARRIVDDIPMTHGAIALTLFVARPVIALICAWTLFHYVETPVSTWARERLLRMRMFSGLALRMRNPFPWKTL